MVCVMVAERHLVADSSSMFLELHEHVPTYSEIVKLVLSLNMIIIVKVFRPPQMNVTLTCSRKTKQASKDEERIGNKATDLQQRSREYAERASRR